MDESQPFYDSKEDFCSITLSSTFEERTRYKKPEAHASWLTAAQIMIADMIGVGVLTLATVMSDLGWVMGISFIILFFPINVYTSLLLWQVRKIYPQSVSYIDMSRYSFKNWGKFMSRITAILVYLHIFMVLSDYLLVIGQSLGLIFYDFKICKPWWMLIGCFCILPFNQIRLLNSTKILCWVNMATITMAVFLTLGYLIVEGIEQTLEKGAVKELVNENLDIWIFSRAFSKIAFSYAGQFIYLEIMAEMKEKNHFPKTFAFTGPYQVGLYLLVGCIGYHYKGSGAEGMLIDNIAFSIWLRLAALLLFIHMLITYLIKGNVMSRAIHLAFFPKTVNNNDSAGSITWFCISTCLLLGCFLVANLIPFFDSLTGLIGALLIPTNSWNLPIMFYVASKGNKNLKIPIWEWILLITIFCFGLVLTYLGTHANVADIIVKWESVGLPFACHCEDIWNTCDCSPDHTKMICNITVS